MASASGVAGRRWAGAVGSALTVLLAAGCATMPDSGSPETVRGPQGAGADQGIQVRVLPVPPRDGLTPVEVLQNFLDASAADEADYKTAKQYLAGDAVTDWQPDKGAVVLDSTTAQPPSNDDPLATGQIVLTVSQHQVGTLDSKHTYRGTDTRFNGTFTLVNTAKDAKDGKDPKDAAARAEWRIINLPPGLVLDASSFRNAYQQVDRYFFTQPDPQAGGTDQPVLVPDPVYLRRRIDPASAAARALAQEGPSAWLGPAVRSAFDGTHPADTVSADDPHQPRLQVDGVDCQADQQRCHQMAAQLYFTLASLNSSNTLDKVTVQSKHGSVEFTATMAKNVPFAPGALAGGGQAYLRNPENGQLDQLQHGDNPVAVPGVLGGTHLPTQLQPAGGTVGPYAVRRDGQAAAVVSQDGRALYVAGLDDGTKSLGQAVLTSRAPHADQGLASPSWDGYGDLFVVDRDPTAPRVMMVRGQHTVQVSLDGLADGQTVDGLKVSSDGTRVAVLVRNAATSTRTLEIGLIRRIAGDQEQNVAITQLRGVAPAQLSDVASVSWADPDTLLALGKESDGLLQLHYLSTDGSSTLDNALQADNMTVVAASEARTDRVLADAGGQDHTVYGLPVGQPQPQWRVVGKSWALPSYPD